MLKRHYAPRAQLECGAGTAEIVARLRAAGERVGWLRFGDTGAGLPTDATTVIMPNNPREYAARLFAVLHDLDRSSVQRIVVELPPDTEEWLAIRDRLARATAPPSQYDAAGT